MQSFLTRVLVVADSEVRRDVAANIAETVGAVGSVASNVGSALPDDLGEVAPLLEEAHVWVCEAVVAGVKGLLSVVEEVGDDGGDVGRLDTSCNVLAVSTTVDITVTC